MIVKGLTIYSKRIYSPLSGKVANDVGTLQTLYKHDGCQVFGSHDHRGDAVTVVKCVISHFFQCFPNFTGLLYEWLRTT